MSILIFESKLVVMSMDMDSHKRAVGDGMYGQEDVDRNQSQKEVLAEKTCSAQPLLSTERGR